MEYRFPPLYKYLFLIGLIYLFMLSYKQITPDMFLIFSFLFAIFYILSDFMLIYDHPSIIEIKINPKSPDTDDDEPDNLIDFSHNKEIFENLNMDQDLEFDDPEGFDDDTDETDE